MHQRKAILHPQPPFDLKKSLSFMYSFQPMNDVFTVEDRDHLIKAVMVEGVPVVFAVSASGSVESQQLTCVFYAAFPITDMIYEAAVQRVCFFLSLEDDLRPFYRIGERDTAFCPVIQAMYGYHQVKFLTPFENACWAVLSQRTPGTAAKKMKQELVRRYGCRIEGFGQTFHVFPHAQRLQAVSVDEFHDILKNEQKARFLYHVVQAFSSVDESFFRYGNDEEVKAWLMSIKGIGEWSASFILLRGLGRMQEVPLSEKMFGKAVRHIYGSQESGVDRIRFLAERYGAYQGYWAHYLRAVTGIPDFRARLQKKC